MSEQSCQNTTEPTKQYLRAEAQVAIAQLKDWRYRGGWKEPGSEEAVNTNFLLNTLLVDHPHRDAVMREIRRLVHWSDYVPDKPSLK